MAEIGNSEKKEFLEVSDYPQKYLADIGMDLVLPKRIVWTEFLPDGGRVFHYTTEDEFWACKNEKRTA